MLQIFRKLWHNNTTNPSQCLEKNDHMHPPEGSRETCQTQGEEAMQHRGKAYLCLYCLVHTSRSLLLCFGVQLFFSLR